MKFEDLVQLWGKDLFLSNHNHNPPSNLVILDAYFAIIDFVDFHPFVCLGKETQNLCPMRHFVYWHVHNNTAILLNARENLEDLEQSEIRTMLLRLPYLNIQRVSRLSSLPPSRQTGN